MGSNRRVSPVCVTPLLVYLVQLNFPSFLSFQLSRVCCKKMKFFWDTSHLKPITLHICCYYQHYRVTQLLVETSRSKKYHILCFIQISSILYGSILHTHSSKGVPKGPTLFPAIKQWESPSIIAGWWPPTVLAPLVNFWPCRGSAESYSGHKTLW